MSQLKRRINAIQGIALAVGMVVGSGLFGLPGLVVDLVGARGSLVAWLATSLIVAPMIYIFIKLGIRFPEAGGLAKYAQVALGDWAEYGVTSVLLGTYTIGIPALALVGAAYLEPLIGVGGLPKELLAFALLLVATVINAVGVRMASSVNSVAVATIFLFILGLVATHASFFGTGIGLMLDVDVKTLDWATLWHAIVLLFWAYIGWENLSFGLEEFKDPKRTIPAVYWGSYGVIVLAYLALAAMVSGAAANGVDVHGLGGLASLLPDNVKSALLAVIVLLILANAISWTFGASRLVFSSARNGILPSFLARLDDRGTPTSALVGLLLFYGVFLLAKFALHIGVEPVIAIVSQNFIVLYALSLLAFAKIFQDPGSRLALAASTAVVAVLLSGFKAWLAYPLLLLLLGFGVWRNRKGSAATEEH